LPPSASGGRRDHRFASAAGWSWRYARTSGSAAKHPIRLPEILLGVIPGWAARSGLPRLIGPARAELIYTGGFVDAEEALRSAW